MRRILLFVYGSLKRGFRHHAELDGAEFCGPRCTEAGYHLRQVGEYPALVAGGAGVVQGELYRLPVSMLPRLDDFEGCPELYQRVLLRLEDGSEAQAYVMQAGATEGCSVIEGGAFVAGGPRGQERGAR